MSHDVTIVVIEDESEILRFLRTTLPTHGFRICEATSGQGGLIEIKTRNPDLILLDLGLPDMDGAEVIRQVREWTSTPIIVLSAREQEQQKVAALDLGADDYVTKPVWDQRTACPNTHCAPSRGKASWSRTRILFLVWQCPRGS